MKTNIRPLLRTVTTATVVSSLFLATGCSQLGPKSVATDRFDYSTAIAESWKKQTLLNIVKLRYMDLPVFVDVASVVAGYSLQTGVNVNGTASSSGAAAGDFLTVGGSAVYTDRPTVTYVPMTGEKFLRGLIKPIEPRNIFFMIQSGYAADFLLGLTVESLNGVQNRSFSSGVTREADPDFLRALRLIREVQASGAVGVQVEGDANKAVSTVLMFRRENVPPEVLEKSREIRRLLRLSESQQKFKLSYAPMAGAEDELAVNSRSMMQIMSAFASYIDVPADHLRARRALPGPELKPDDPGVHVRSSKNKPADAYAAVYYRDHWFWIEDSDWLTKRALTSIMFFFTLAETDDKQNLPVLTIPAQ
jgi:hypothetical protein